MSELSVQQTKLLNNYLKDNPDISRSKAIEILFGSSKGKADGKGITLERTQFENSELNAMADEFYSIADDNSGSTTFNKMKEFLNTKITPDNIVGFLDAYEDAKRGDNSIIDTVMSDFELFSNKRRNEVLTLINDKLCKAAEQAGVSDEDIAYARDAFNSNLGDTVEMEKAVKFLLGAIKSKQTVANTPEISIPDAMSEFSTMYSDTTNVANEIFEEARNQEGSIAKGADTVLGWFGCTTAEDMREKLGADAEAAEKLTQAAEAVRKNPQDKAAMKAFNDAYKETFGIEFDANKIAAREAAWTTYATAESLATTAKNLKATFFDRPVPKEYINFSQRIRQVTGLSNEELDAVIESYSTNLNMPAQTDEDKRQILKQYVQDLGKNITEQYNTVTQGKSLEQLKRDAELLDKSAFGTKDIVRDVIQYNENQAITAMVTEGGLEIAGTVALQFVPGLGQAASARLAASAAKWGNRGVKVANYLNKAEKGFAAAQKFQQGTKFTSTVANRTAQVVSQSAAAGAATATLGVIDGKDAEDIMRRTLMNMSFAGAGATSSVLAPKLMQSFGITDSALANEIAEEIINTAASYGITTLSGSDYTEADGFIDFATGLVMSRISHVNPNNSEIKEVKKKFINLAGETNYKHYEKYYDFKDETILRLAYNFLKNNDEELSLTGFLNEIKYSDLKPEFREMLLNLSDNGASSSELFNFLQVLSDNNNMLDKITNINDDIVSPMLSLQKQGYSNEYLTQYLKLKIENPNMKSVDLLKNYTNRYSQLVNDGFNKTSSSAIFNELYILVNDAELNGENLTKQNLKEYFSSIRFENNNISADERLYLEFDKKMFDDLTKLIDSVPINDGETLSNYLLRINEMRLTQDKHQASVQSEVRLSKNKAFIESRYSETGVPLDEIKLTPEEQAEYNKNLELYIYIAGNPGTHQGDMGYGRPMPGLTLTRDKLADLALQTYPRYNSTEYFANNKDKIIYGNTGIYKYPPVIRYLAPSKRIGMFNNKTVVDIVDGYPDINEIYQPHKLECCFTTPYGSNEDKIASDVIVEIHPRSETSKAHFVKGWGNEVRYGGNSRFIVVDKYYEVQEYEANLRNVKGHVVLQEL